MAKRCPGQDLRLWRPEDIFESECPDCGEKIEFFKDDIFRRCSRCKQKVTNPAFDFGCAKWCQYAEECLGTRAKHLRSGAIKTQTGSDKKNKHPGA